MIGIAIVLSAAAQVSARCSELSFPEFEALPHEAWRGQGASAVGASVEVSLRTFVNKGRTATLAVRCLPRSTSRAEALNEFSKTGETLTKIAEDLYSVERKAGLLGITSYLRIGDEAHVVSLVSEADGAERSRLRAAIIQVLSRP